MGKRGKEEGGVDKGWRQREGRKERRRGRSSGGKGMESNKGNVQRWSVA